MDLDLRRTREREHVRWCAQLMAGSEPWITLGRDYDACVDVLSDPERELYVATLGGERVGFVLLVMKGAFVGYIQSVAISPDRRGEGIGSHIIGLAEGRIFRDSPNVFMCVSSFNPRAKALYLRMGYEVVGDLTDYIVPGHSETLLRKTIGPKSEFVGGRVDDKATKRAGDGTRGLEGASPREGE